VLEALRGEFSNCKLAQELGERFERALPQLRCKLDKALGRIVGRKFVSTEYDDVVRSYLLLDRMKMKKGVSLVNESEVGTQIPVMADEREFKVNTSARESEETITLTERVIQKKRLILSENTVPSSGSAIEEQGRSFRNATGKVFEAISEQQQHHYHHECVANFPGSNLGGDCMDRLTENVLSWQLRDITTCVRVVLLEQIYTSNCCTDSGSLIDAAELSLSELATQISAGPMAVGCVLSCLEGLSNVIHTHYLVMQWHRCPFDPRNEDPSFLHRCGIDSLDDDSHESKLEPPPCTVAAMATAGAKDEPRRGSCGVSLRDVVHSSIEASFRLFMDTEANGLASVAADGTASATLKQDQQQIDLDTARLTFTFLQLATSREALWRSAEATVIDLLRSMSFSAVDLEAFLTMTWALNTFIHLGLDFCGTASPSLRATIKDVSVRYFLHVHADSFSLLRQMLEVELWHSVPLRLGEVGGVLGLIRRSLTRADSARANRVPFETLGMQQKVLLSAGAGGTIFSSDATIDESDTCDIKGTIRPQKSLLESFHTVGNPLKVIFESILPSHSSSCGRNSYGKGETGRTNINGDHENIFLGLLEADEVKLTRAEGDAHVGDVMTQACVNGVLRFTGQYLQMMSLMGSVSAEIFSGLGQLFDLYLCYVFSHFVDAEFVERLRGRPHRSSSGPPESNRDFQALLLYMDRYGAHPCRPCE
jgi:hypothetical protein